MKPRSVFFAGVFVSVFVAGFVFGRFKELRVYKLEKANIEEQLESTIAERETCKETAVDLRGRLEGMVKKEVPRIMKGNTLQERFLTAQKVIVDTYNIFGLNVELLLQSNKKSPTTSR